MIAALTMVVALLSGCGHKAAFSAAEEYIQEHYPHQTDWRLETYCDFFHASENTWIHAYAPGSQDLYFRLYYDSSKERLEDYHDEGMQSSLHGEHTYYRLFNEYHDLMQAKELQCGLSLSVKLLTDQAAKDALWQQGVIYLDIPFSTDLPLDWEIYYWKDVDHAPTVEEAAEDIQALGKFLIDNDLPAARLSGHFTPKAGPDSSFHIPAQLAYDPNLLTKLNAAKITDNDNSSWTIKIP